VLLGVYGAGSGGVTEQWTPDANGEIMEEEKEMGYALPKGSSKFRVPAQRDLHHAERGRKPVPAAPIKLPPPVKIPPPPSQLNSPKQ
jgi:hypothetical protein